jgi:hypothetical protein
LTVAESARGCHPGNGALDPSAVEAGISGAESRQGFSNVQSEPMSCSSDVTVGGGR